MNPLASPLTQKQTFNLSVNANDTGRDRNLIYYRVIKTIAQGAQPIDLTLFNQGSADTTIEVATSNDSSVDPSYQPFTGEFNDAFDDSFKTGLVRINTTAPGTGFTSRPTVVITPVDGGSGATAEAFLKALSGSFVAAGTGYLPADTITLAGGTKVTTAVLTVATVKAVSTALVAPGTGYNVADTITAAGGTSSTKAIVTVGAVKIVAVATIADGGASYVEGDILTAAGGTGTAAIFQVDTTNSGVITGLSLVSGGSYTVKPGSPISLTGGSGTGAQITATYGVSTITVTTAGSYTVVPSSPIAQFATSGSGTGATFSLGWGVLTATVSTAGKYSALPANAVAQASTSGSGSGATVNITWGVGDVDLTEAGDGYNVAPTATISGGGGNSATLTATINYDSTFITVKPGGFKKTPLTILSDVLWIRIRNTGSSAVRGELFSSNAIEQI
jgi:hypothetical protein